MRGIVWARTFKSGIRQLEKIEQEYNFYNGIKTEIKRLINPHPIIKFENGDIWEVCLSIESSKGYRTNISYIEHGISNDFIKYVIKPCTRRSPYQAFNYFWGDEE